VQLRCDAAVLSDSDAHGAGLSAATVAVHGEVRLGHCGACALAAARRRTCRGLWGADECRLRYIACRVAAVSQLVMPAASLAFTEIAPLRPVESPLSDLLLSVHPTGSLVPALDFGCVVLCDACVSITSSRY
jgi:hypothetical protein